MSINPSLSISSLVSVSASLAATAVQGQGTSTKLVLGSSSVIDVVTRMRSFQSSTAVATLFGSNAPETLFAIDWFEQVPQPGPLLIGRWAQTASAGQLIGSPLTATQMLLSTWQAITDGGFTITVDGAGSELVTGVNFSAVSNMNGVAAAINGHLTGATMAFNAVDGNFIVTSATTGAASAVTFATAPTGGGGVVDISTLLGLTAASSGCFEANGIAAETAVAAVTLFDELFGQQWYGLSILGAADADDLAATAFLQGSSNKHFYFKSTQEAGVLVAATTSDIASALKASNVSKTAVQYNSSSPYSAASLAARMLSIDYSGSNTVTQAMYQQEPGVKPDALNSNQLAVLLSKNCNGFLAYNNGASIIQPGICSNGQFIDTVIGADALSLAIQTAVFNLLLTTHIPQTDAGMHQVKVTIEQVLTQFVNNGYIAPGVWTGPLFGNLQNNPDGTPPNLSKGYYVFQPPVASQSAGQRAQRLSVPFQIAVKLAGAVQSVSVAITLNN
jgi:hypothetical protein